MTPKKIKNIVLEIVRYFSSFIIAIIICNFIINLDTISIYWCLFIFILILLNIFYETIKKIITKNDFSKDNK